MQTEDRESSPEQDWRLQAELATGDAHGALHGLVGRLRGPDVVKEMQAEVPHDVVITHDGKLLFAYAADEATLAAARRAIEGVLERDGIKSTVRVSRWDNELDRWQQTDPPASDEERRVQDAADRDADAVETRTLVTSSGNLVRTEFEQSMLAWAARLGLECNIIEHPHLLTTQVGFTVTGPKRRIDEFVQGLNAEGRATVRAETGVMLSPL
jgi:hypothetical protein